MLGYYNRIYHGQQIRGRGTVLLKKHQGRASCPSGQALESGEPQGVRRFLCWGAEKIPDTLYHWGERCAGEKNVVRVELQAIMGG